MSDNMLREKIAHVLYGNVLWKPPEADREFLTLRMADRILALPEIAEAFRVQEIVNEAVRVTLGAVPPA